ncbi:hypothetical protein NMY22_g13915 [Coprinellus aureogranulatus]|nr:hypothetical protein NMY22_g13915 [Coprinellus aureogranulatus]
MSQPPPGQQVVNIADLDIPQLSDVKKQLEEELSHLTNSFAQLKQAQNKFKQCIENVKELGVKENKDKSILVPLTNSLYLPGKLVNPDHVIVDVGTGYYVKKSHEQATKHYSQKVSYIQSNLERLEETIQKKRENVNVLVQILQQKVQAQINANPAGSSAKGAQVKLAGIQPLPLDWHMGPLARPAGQSVARDSRVLGFQLGVALSLHHLHRGVLNQAFVFVPFLRLYYVALVHPSQRGAGPKWGWSFHSGSLQNSGGLALRDLVLFQPCSGTHSVAPSTASMAESLFEGVVDCNNAAQPLRATTSSWIEQKRLVLISERPATVGQTLSVISPRPSIAMSLRVRCRSDPTADDEYQNTVAPKSPSWTAAGSVFRAGRELSSWVFGKPTTPRIHPIRPIVVQSTSKNLPAESTPLHHINALPQEMLEEHLPPVFTRPQARGLWQPTRRDCVPRRCKGMLGPELWLTYNIFVNNEATATAYAVPKDTQSTPSIRLASRFPRGNSEGISDLSFKVMQHRTTSELHGACAMLQVELVALG